MFILVFVTLTFFVFVFVAVKSMNRNGDFCWRVEWHLRTNFQTLPRAGWLISPGLRWCDVQRYQPLKESCNILLNRWVLEAFCCFNPCILHVPNLTTQTDMVILESLKGYIAKSSWFKPFIRSVFKDHSASFFFHTRNATWFTRPFQSCVLSLCQNESSCETIRMKMCSVYRFIFTHFFLLCRIRKLSIYLQRRAFSVKKKNRLLGWLTPFYWLFSWRSGKHFTTLPVLKQSSYQIHGKMNSTNFSI